MPAPPPLPRPKLLAGKYEPVAPIGKGGFASVWSGYTHGEAGFRRKIAIKRVLRHLNKDEKFEAMFVEEARVVSELNHPNIVQVHDFGRDREGGYFIIMEWVDGLNLKDYVRSFTRIGEYPPWPLSCAICIEALRALGAAHSRVDAQGRPVPVIHRDVTPANIMVGNNGSVKLADFGLARAMDRPGTTDPNVAKGKVAYMAPEILDGAKPDTRCDIYAMGVVLWETLTAERLFGEGSEIDIAMKAMKGEYRALDHVRPGLPPELYAIVNTALIRDPRNRFQYARAMIEALSAMLRSQPEPTDGTVIARAVHEAMARLPHEVLQISEPPPPVDD